MSKPKGKKKGRSKSKANKRDVAITPKTTEVVQKRSSKKRAGYDIAKTGRLTSKLHQAATAANSIDILSADGATIRRIGRYLARNTAQGKRTVRYIASKVIGPNGIVPVFDDDALNVAFSAWKEKSGIRGETWQAIQRITLSDYITAGEGFSYDGFLDGKFVLGMFEPEDLEPTSLSHVQNTIDGIEYDKWGRPTRYLIADPGDFSQFGQSFSVVELPASRVYHLFLKERPSQIRGASDMAAGSMALFDMTDAEFAELTGIRAQGYMGIHVKGDTEYNQGADPEDDFNAETVDATNGADDGGTDLEINMEFGEVISSPAEISLLESNRPGPNFASLMDVFARKWAVSVGIPTHVSDGDYSKANYSSLRAAENTSRATYEETQEVVLSRQAKPTVRKWLESSIITGEIAVRPEKIDEIMDRVEWTVPGFRYVDPLKEIQAEERELNGGKMTFDQWCARHGLDGRKQRRAIQLKRKLDEEFDVKTPDVGWQEFIPHVPSVDDEEAPPAPRSVIEEVG